MMYKQDISVIGRETNMSTLTTPPHACGQKLTEEERQQKNVGLLRTRGSESR